LNCANRELPARLPAGALAAILEWLLSLEEVVKKYSERSIPELVKYFRNRVAGFDVRWRCRWLWRLMLSMMRLAFPNKDEADDPLVKSREMDLQIH